MSTMFNTLSFDSYQLLIRAISEISFMPCDCCPGPIIPTLNGIVRYSLTYARDVNFFRNYFAKVVYSSNNRMPESEMIY